MKNPLIGIILSVLSSLNGTSERRGILAYQGISGTDMATLRQINLR